MIIPDIPLLIAGFFGSKSVFGYLARVIVSGVQMAISTPYSGE
jgi:hypothetical protein